MSDKPFWSDDFDMDLLKVFPDLPEKLGATKDVLLWTVGHETYGRLNHPAVWNSHMGSLAFFWLEPPVLERREGGWFTLPGGYTDDSPLVECTWLEVLRDGWVHGFAMVLKDRIVWNARDIQQDFDRIMADLRGYHKQDVSEHRARALASLMRANRNFAAIVEEHRLLAGADYPYFSGGSVS